MLNRVTLDQLQVLVTAAETGSFSAAARRLNRVQSAVSQTIRALEDALELELFDRSQKLPRLTDAGAAMVEDARRILGGVDGLRARARSIATVAEPEISLAIEQVFPNLVLTACLHEFRERFPSVSITVYGEGLGAPEQALMDGEAGLAIYSPAQDGTVGLQMEFLGEVPISVVAGAGHPLARHGGMIGQSELDEHVQLILTDRSGRYRGVVMNTRTWSFVDQNTRLDFALAGFGWSLMPLHLARPHLESGALVAIRLAVHNGLPLRFPLYAAYKIGRPPGPAAQWLLGDLRRRFAEWSGDAPGAPRQPGIQIRVTPSGR